MFGIVKVTEQFDGTTVFIDRTTENELSPQEVMQRQIEACEHSVLKNPPWEKGAAKAA